MNYQPMITKGYTEYVHGFSGAFTWFRSALKPGFWLVIAHEESFSRDGWAVTDDFGNLVRVQS